MCLQREMPRIEHVCLDILQIAAVRSGTLSREDKVILPPDNERGWLEFAEELLKGWIERHIGAIVKKEIELDLGVAGSIQTQLVQHPSGRVQEARVLHAILVLPLGRFRVHQETNCFTILGCRLVPVFLDRVPELQKTLVIRVAVLNDQRLNAFGVTESKTIANRRTVVHHVHRIVFQAEMFDKSVHNVIRFSKVYENSL